MKGKNESGRADERRRPDQAEAPALLPVTEVARLLSCSTRHVYRLSDAGRMPRSLKLGGLVRWRRVDLEEWISAGCRPGDKAR